MAFENILSFRLDRGFLWVTMPEAVTMENYASIEDKLCVQIDEGHTRLVLDLADTQNVYSSGIGLMVRLRRILAEKNGLLCLVNVSRKLQLLFESMHLEKVFPIYATDVEFELSNEEVWREKLAEEKFDFVFITQIEQGKCRLTLSGHMDALHDLSAVNEFRPDCGPQKYVFNLESLDVLDTYGSQVFMELIQRIQAVRGECIVYGANDIVKELFALLSIDKMVQFAHTEQDAAAL